MNILVIATHHGAFLTLEQIRVLGKECLVVIPQSQIDKYKTYEGSCFQNFQTNIADFAPGVCMVDETWKPTKSESARAFLRAMDCTGQWLVLEAGSLLGNVEKLPQTSTFGMTYDRVHPKLKRLYEMLGKPTECTKLYTGSFIVNMDDNSGKVTLLPSETFKHQDILYKKSFSALGAIRYHDQPCIAENFWMDSIGTPEGSEWIGYPFARYAELANEVAPLLPRRTLETIRENGEKSAWLKPLIDLKL